MRGRGVVRTPGPAAACIPVLVVECIPARAADSTRVLAEVFTLVLAAGFTQVPAADCTQVRGEASIMAPAAACIRGLAMSHIGVTYHRGRYSSSILNSTECGIWLVSSDPTCRDKSSATVHIEPCL